PSPDDGALDPRQSSSSTNEAYNQSDQYSGPSGQIRGRRRVWPILIALTALLVAVSTIVGLVMVRGARPETDPLRPSPTDGRMWPTKIANTWSTGPEQFVGVYRYNSPFRPDKDGSAYPEGTLLHVVCQERHGREVVDPTTTRASTVWDRTADGSWIPDLY